MFQYTAKQRTIRKSEKKSGLQGKVQEMLPHLKKTDQENTDGCEQFCSKSSDKLQTFTFPQFRVQHTLTMWTFKLF